MTTGLFSNYRQGVNRVTGSILSVFQRLSFSLVQQILQALLQEPETELLTFRNHVAGPASVPDGRIRASFSYWIETKIVPNSVQLQQIQGHIAAMNADLTIESQRLIVLTPDDTKPDVLNQLEDGRVAWASFEDLVAAIRQAVAFDESWITSERPVVTERERELLRELAHFLISEGLVGRSGQQVLVVPARHALGDYEKLCAYICQPNRTFQRCSHMALYVHGVIHSRVPAIQGSIESIVLSEEGVDQANLTENERARFLSIVRSLAQAGDQRLGGENKVIFLSGPDDPETIILPHDIRNDLVNDSGRPYAFTQGQRYVQLKSLRAAPRTTSELVRLEA